jgi:hypothetical protein
MDRRPRLGSGHRSRQADTDAEAATTVTAIAGLRRRLRRPDVLEHPAVQRELRRLDEQITAQLAEKADRRPGRHRSARSSTLARRGDQQIGDACGFDLKPDPIPATTEAQFIRALWEYKAWSGDPSWRSMAARAGQTVVHSTMYAAMNGTTLPKLDVVKAIINGCGGTDDDLKAFATAWRRIDSATSRSRTPGAGFLTAPVQALELVPG